MTDTPGYDHTGQTQQQQQSQSPGSGEDQSQFEPNFREYEQQYKAFEAKGANPPETVFRDTLEIRDVPQRDHAAAPSIPKDLLAALRERPEAAKVAPAAYRAASLLTAPYRVVRHRKSGNSWNPANALSNVSYDIDDETEYVQPEVFEIDKELLSTKAKTPQQVK